ncbi:winged helix-turn-helix domain-containing protein [Mycobacterium paraintracellulare]|nr:winged helix-turn-helix domain-containing protein [Mycobacterium paraintracellulare]
MAFDKTWLQAVKEVLRESGKPMHYTDIAQAIVDQDLRKNPGPQDQ